MQKRLVVFKTKNWKSVLIQKEFNDDAHEDNYINYMCRTRKWIFDTIYEL